MVPDRVFELFAQILEYPTADIFHQARECTGLLAPDFPEAAAHMEAFCNSIEQLPLQRLEEVYTSTFDMQPVCYPYVGYHLFGESYKRGAFMARLNQGYRQAGFSAGNELPDHVAVVLRFLAVERDVENGDFSRSLRLEGLIPALEKMVGAMRDQATNPYEKVISALLLVEQTEKELSNG